jgi:hypothetical protein
VTRTKTKQPAGWYVCGAVMHYYAAGGTLCKRTAEPGQPFSPNMGYRGAPSPSFAPHCKDCQERHTELWATGGGPR